MIGVALSSRDRRTAIVGMAAFVAILGVGRGLPAWKRWDAMARDRAERMHALAAISADSGVRLAALREAVRVEERRAAGVRAAFLDGDTPGEAAALLAGGLTTGAEDVGVRITNVQLQPDTGFVGGTARVGLRLAGSGDVRGLTAFLRDTEAGTPLVRVIELTVSQSDPGAGPGQPEMLRFELGLEALTLDPRIGQ